MDAMNLKAIRSLPEGEKQWLTRYDFRYSQRERARASRPCPLFECAGVAELVDARDLKPYSIKLSS